MPSAEVDSIEFFLMERYLLFVERKGALYEGQVHHTPYPAHRVNVVECNSRLIEAAGLPAGRSDPAFAHYSPGVEVAIFTPQPVSRPHKGDL